MSSDVVKGASVLNLAIMVLDAVAACVSTVCTSATAILWVFAFANFFFFVERVEQRVRLNECEAVMKYGIRIGFALLHAFAIGVLATCSPMNVFQALMIVFTLLNNCAQTMLLVYLQHR